jgi:hypothetical protein
MEKTENITGIGEKGTGLKILALDLGTKTGWALLKNGAVSSGTWLLANEKELRSQKKANLDRCCDMRPSQLQARVIQVGDVDWIYFEDVQFLSSQLQAQLWASLRCIVTLFYPKIKLRAVPVGTLKKFATGKGNADKAAMMAAIPGFTGDDNEADAIHLLHFARKELSV